MSQLISFCINTSVNERNHIELLFRSLRVNLSRKDHEILVYVENDNQNTVDFLKDQKSLFPNLKIIINPLPVPIGYARNINLMFEMASHEIVSYIQSDMVIGPNYDQEILKFLAPDTIISATRIEPPLHPPSPEKITHDFGLDPLQFDLDRFNSFANTNKKNQLTDFWFAPFTLYKKNWLEIGGHDTLFRRSREDSDLLYRFTMKGLKIKQAWNAIVYHFTCTSSRGIEWWTEKAKLRTQLQQSADAIEMKRFLRKWPDFKHTTTFDPSSEFKYQISANFYDVSLNDFSILDYHWMFHRIYVDNPVIYYDMKFLYDQYHILANQLLNISDEQWQTYKKYYRRWEFEDIFVSRPIQNDDVILDLSLSNKTFEDFFHSPYGKHIRNIGKEYIRPMESTFTTPEEYEIEAWNAKLTVNRVVNRITENIRVENPPLDINFVIL